MKSVSIMAAMSLAFTGSAEAARAAGKAETDLNGARPGDEHSAAGRGHSGDRSI
jgi:hypothetical protein